MPSYYEDKAREKEKESWRKEWDLHRDNPKNKKNKGNEKKNGVDIAKKNKGKGISGEGAYSKPLPGAPVGQNLTAAQIWREGDTSYS